MANEYWITEFETNGAPTTGLSPTITIVELPNTVAVNAAAMTEIANLTGSYYYLHTTYDPDKNYKARADAGTDSVDNRYAYASNSDDLQISGKLPTNFFMGSSDGTDKDDEIDAIKAKTDNLPTDPADQSLIEAAISTSESNIRGGTDTLDTISTQLDAVQVDLDNPNQYKADVSALATEANATTNKNSIITEIDANETKIDTIDTVVDAIKVVTDNLPADTNTILNRLLGISDENCYIDNYTYNVDGNMTGCRKRIYNSKTNAESHGATGLLATYTVTVTWSDDEVASYLMVIE